MSVSVCLCLVSVCVCLSVYVYVPLCLCCVSAVFTLTSPRTSPSYINSDIHGPGLIMPCSNFGRRVYYEFIEFIPLLDSSCMDMTDWVKIARTIENHDDAWDGFVVLHGEEGLWVWLVGVGVCVSVSE